MQFKDKIRKPNLDQRIRYLNPEIINEILSRLPVKSLLQFRSVSKLWCSIISDPKFTKTHLNTCSKNVENAHSRLIFISYHRMTFKICHISPVLNLVSVNPTELDYPVERPDPVTIQRKFLHNVDNSDSIVGSINGLIAIAIGNYLTFLWNPSTRISKTLPKSGYRLRHGSLDVNYGFGYDESTDDYKLVGVFNTIGDDDDNTPEMWIYSLRNDCWKRIGDFASVGSHELPAGPGKFLKGAIHWLVNCGVKDKPSRSIVCLDLAMETYSELPEPNYDEGKFPSRRRLDVVGESLFLMCECIQNNTIDVWIMKEYGVRESWTKFASFPYMTGTHKSIYPMLLHMSKEGEILLACDLDIMLYDPKTKSLRNLDVPEFDAGLGASTYIESLVSPLIHEGQERHQ